MPEFRYKATELSGKHITGSLSAKNEDELRASLRDKGLFLDQAEKAEVKTQFKKLKANQLSEFCRELGTMLQAGVPLIRALNIMASRDIPGKIKAVYNALYDRLKQGLMLSEAMAELGVFPDLLVNMYKASEISGQMDLTSIKMSEHYMKSYKLAKKVRSAMTYPIILAIVTFIVMMVIFLVVLPKFFSIFSSMGTELPGLTKFMLDFSTFLQSNWIWVLIGILVFVLLIKMLMQIPPIRRGRDHLRLKLPVVGKLLKVIYTARFARVLSSTYSSGVSIINALLSARDTVSNTYISSQFPQMIQKVRNGDSLSSAIGMIDGFDKKLAATIMIGEETGKLDDMLSTMADSFDYDSEISLQRLTSLVEPVMIIIMALIIGTIMISVILPLSTLYSTIGAGY